MEALQQRQTAETHEQKGFDREARTRNDTATWLAEVLNGSMRSDFEFIPDGQELYGEDGQALRQIFDNSIIAARIMAERNPGMVFELRRNLIERGELTDMEDMALGELQTDDGQVANTMVVVSDHPPELMDSSQDVGGYNSNRKQTMLRIITLEPDGSVHITSQSLDRSDRRALEAIYASLGKQAQPGELLGQRINLSLSPRRQRKLAENLARVYDDEMERQHGGKWHAGIKKDKKRLAADTYKFARNQTDLIDYFTQLKLADSRLAEKQRYAVAAAANARYERKVSGIDLGIVTIPGSVSPARLVSPRSIIGAQPLIRELQREGTRAAEKGQVFSGCGVSVSSENDPDNPLSTGNKLSLSGYGNKKEDEDEYGSLTFKCQNGHENTRPRHKLIDRCKHCQVAVSCGPKQKRPKPKIERQRGQPAKINHNPKRQRRPGAQNAYNMSHERDHAKAAGSQHFSASRGLHKAVRLARGRDGEVRRTAVLNGRH